jgi:hypothetical protein
MSAFMSLCGWSFFFSASQSELKNITTAALLFVENLDKSFPATIIFL